MFKFYKIAQFMYLYVMQNYVQFVVNKTIYLSIYLSIYLCVAAESHVEEKLKRSHLEKTM